jgi:hypothetical protein
MTFRAPPITWVTTSYDPIIPCVENKLIGTPTFMYKDYAFITDREYKDYTGRVIVYRLVDKVWVYHHVILPPTSCYDFGNAICGSEEFLFVSSSTCFSSEYKDFKRCVKGMVHIFRYNVTAAIWTYSDTIYPKYFYPSQYPVYNTGINLTCTPNTLVIGFATDYDKATNLNYNGAFVIYRLKVNVWVFKSLFTTPQVAPPVKNKMIPPVESECKLVGVSHYCCCQSKYISGTEKPIRDKNVLFSSLIKIVNINKINYSKTVEPKTYFGINCNKITSNYIFTSYNMGTSSVINLYRNIYEWKYSNSIEITIDPQSPYTLNIIGMPLEVLTDNTFFTAVQIRDKEDDEIVYGYLILVFYKNPDGTWLTTSKFDDNIDIISPSKNLYMAGSVAGDGTPFLFVSDFLKTRVYSAPSGNPYGNWYLYQEIENKVCANDTELLAKYLSIFGDYSLLTFSNNYSTLYIYSFSGGDPHVVTIFNEKYLLPKGSNYFNLFTDSSIGLSIKCHCNYIEKNSFPQTLYIRDNYVDISNKDDLEIFTNTYYRKFKVTYGGSDLTIDADTLEITGVLDESVKVIEQTGDCDGLYSITYSNKYPKTDSLRSILIEIGDYILTLVSDIATDERHYVKLISVKDILVKNLSGALIAESPKNMISEF